MLTSIVVQARVGSRRYPYKVLKPLTPEGMSVLEFQLRRLYWAKLPVVVAIPDTWHDDEIEDLCTHMHFAYHIQNEVVRGDEDDVLSRYVKASMRGDAIVRITSDCPLVCPDMIRDMVAEFKRRECTYLSNCHPTRTVPRGFEIEVMTRSVLELADKMCKDPEQREHVTQWIYTQPDRFDIQTYTPPTTFSYHKNLSIDGIFDRLRVKRLVAKLPEDFRYADVAEKLG